MSKSHNFENNDFSKYLLRRIDDWGEYFTVKATGRSGMSQIGLARFVGKHQTTISRWVNQVRTTDPMHNNLPDSLKPFAGKFLRLMHYTDPQGRDILEDKFCAVMVEYFAQYAEDTEDNFQAKKALSLIRNVGMRQLIHLKTGWSSSSFDEELKDLIEIHRERVTARIRLKHEDRVKLMNSVKEYMRENGLSRKICSDVHDELNAIIQDLPSSQIKRLNGLQKNDLIRDYYDTNYLIDYGSLSRMAANLVSYGIEPIKAVHLAGTLYFSPDRIPQEIPFIENIKKVTKILEAKMKKQKSKNDDNRSFPSPPED